MKIIYSFLSNDVSFPAYIKREGVKVSAMKAKTAILIKGGANVADKHAVTKPYVETKIEDKDLETLNNHPSFKRMVERGFLSTKKPTEKKKDKAAPLTEKAIKAKNKNVKITTNEDTPE